MPLIGVGLLPLVGHLETSKGFDELDLIIYSVSGGGCSVPIEPVHTLTVKNRKLREYYFWTGERIISYYLSLLSMDHFS